MLLPIDTQAVQNSGLRPAGQSALYSVLDVRAVTVQTYQYAAYAAGAHDLQGFVFVPGTLAAGSQIHLRLFGTYDNTSGFSQPFVPAVRVTQASSNTALAAVWNVPTNGDLAAWELDCVITFSVPAATPSLDTKSTVAAVSTATYNGPGLVVGGMARLTLSDSALTGAAIAGGVIVSAPKATDQSFLIATTNPNSVLMVDRTQPIGVTVDVTSDVDFTVQGGWIEAM